MGELHVLPSTGLSTNNADTAARLRRFADQVEAGNFGKVDTVVAVIEAGGNLERQTFGGPIDRARVAGLLAMTIHRISGGD